jgi:hypothetical protein
MADAFLDYLPVAEIQAAFAKAPGNEFGSGKINSKESSAALAANTFGLFLKRPGDLPLLPGLGRIRWTPTYVGLEECARFPWRGGRHPWLDVIVETQTHLIGIESKRYEPYRVRRPGSLSRAYRRPVWGANMVPFERMRDRLSEGILTYQHLDAIQLVKHAFGIRTRADSCGKRPILFYLYAEPNAWPDGRLIGSAALQRHTAEIAEFARWVKGAEVRFASCSYRDLLAAFRTAILADVNSHARALADKFSI